MFYPTKNRKQCICSVQNLSIYHSTGKEERRTKFVLPNQKTDNPERKTQPNTKNYGEIPETDPEYMRKVQVEIVQLDEEQEEEAGKPVEQNQPYLNSFPKFKQIERQKDCYTFQLCL